MLENCAQSRSSNHEWKMVGNDGCFSPPHVSMQIRPQCKDHLAQNSSTPRHLMWQNNIQGMCSNYLQIHLVCTIRHLWCCFSFSFFVRVNREGGNFRKASLNRINFTFCKYSTLLFQSHINTFYKRRIWNYH